MGKRSYKRIVLDNIFFILIFAFMVIYYGYQMFFNRPWYDELYTYYSFISRGPIYAAIHWPVPNNHVLYSVLSAFLDYFGNSYIGLRGISYIAALCNMVLLYKIANKIMNKLFSSICVFLYVSTYLVNSLSVQGRGYTLATTCYLIVITCLYHICCEKDKKRYYIIYAIALTAGLYTLVSSTFWVIPICMTGGVYLLIKKEYKKLLRLILFSLLAAVMTFFLYLLIWLAIGANLLSKDATSAYYGIYQVNIILAAPIKSFLTGVNYMLSTPYVQSIARVQVIQELFFYLTTLFDLFYNGMGKIFVTLLGFGMIFSFYMFMKYKIEKITYSFYNLYIFISIILLPVMLIIQSVQPYKRVFSYFAVPVSLLISFVLYKLYIAFIGDKGKNVISYIGGCVFFVLSIALLMSNYYRAEYAERENKICDILREAKVTNIQKMYYTDDFQKYVLKFYYDLEPEEVELKDSEYMLVSKETLQPSYEQAIWPVFMAYGGLDMNIIDSDFAKIAENDMYLLYQRKE